MGEKIIYVTGGCRSGKSGYALDYANRHFSKKLYLATCQVLDEEMAKRVEQHQATRGSEWKTIEEPLEIVEKLEDCWDKAQVILLDCMTLWLSNLLMRGDKDPKVLHEVERFVDHIAYSATPLVIVSNEVGMGIVPADPLSRRFRDLSGIMNQKIAGVAHVVVFMVSGMPMFLKGEG